MINYILLAEELREMNEWAKEEYKKREKIMEKYEEHAAIMMEELKEISRTMKEMQIEE